MNIKELKINPEFEAVIPPLSEEEFRQLEDNILQDREVFTPIFTWDGFIVDGHHRYRILQKHPEIPYRIIFRAQLLITQYQATHYMIQCGTPHPICFAFCPFPDTIVLCLCTVRSKLDA